MNTPTFDARLAHILAKGWIKVEAPCQVCKGTGRTEVREYCRSHPSRLYSEWTETERTADTMPCGCGYEKLRSEDFCFECEGSGLWSGTITVAELAGLIRDGSR
jgi:hypothetical protein